ncbi:MAG: hypothetical protein MI919_16520, partial [Holophagales bacterium]|nr:hypothetical protein [Holophagales bacterium]
MSGPTLWQRCRHDLAPSRLFAEAERILKKNWRRLRRVDRRRITLEPRLPEGETEARGRILFSYILDPFLLAPTAAEAGRLPYSHTHFWESWTMARAFADLGYRVDTVSWVNQRFEPETTYDLVLDVRLSLQRWAPSLPDDCLKVLHIDTAHHSFHNPAQQARLLALEARRGCRLSSEKML